MTVEQEPESKHQRRKQPIFLKAYVTAKERELIVNNAHACGLSASAYARSLALGNTPTSVLDLREIRNLMLVRADLGRLGGLLKLWLSDDIRYKEEHGKPIEELLAEINESQEKLAAVIARVDAKLK